MNTGNAAFVLGSLIGLLVIVIVPIVVGIVLIVRSGRANRAAQAAYAHWAQFTAPGAPVINRETGAPVPQKAGTGMRVTGVILLVLGSLLLLGRLVGATDGLR